MDGGRKTGKEKKSLVKTVIVFYSNISYISLKELTVFVNKKTLTQYTHEYIFYAPYNCLQLSVFFHTPRIEGKALLICAQPILLVSFIIDNLTQDCLNGRKKRRMRRRKREMMTWVLTEEVNTLKSTIVY